MIHNQVVIGEQLFKGGFEQEGDGAAVNAGAIGFGHGDGANAGFDIDGVGQFAQFVIDDGADNGRVVPFGQGAQEDTYRQGARAFKGAAIGQMNFYQVARLGLSNRIIWRKIHSHPLK